MKYKVGDKVKIKSKDWYLNNKDENGSVHLKKDTFVDSMAEYCGMEAKIVGFNNYWNEYLIDIDDREWYWTDEMFEDEPVKDEYKPSFFTNIVEAINKAVSENKQGITIEEKDGSIIITPIEDNEEDLPIDTPCMTSDDRSNWYLRYYARDSKCFAFSAKSENGENAEVWKYIIPFDRFNPNDIEESLKYNIVK